MSGYIRLTLNSIGRTIYKHKMLLLVPGVAFGVEEAYSHRCINYLERKFQNRKRRFFIKPFTDHPTLIKLARYIILIN